MGCDARLVPARGSDDTGHQFPGAKTGGSHAGLALREIDDVLKRLEGKTVESFDAKIYLDQKNPGLEQFVTRRITDAIKTGDRESREPGHHRAGDGVRGQDRHSLGGRRVLDEVPQRRPAEGEGGIDGRGRNAAERIAGGPEGPGRSGA